MIGCLLATLCSAANVTTFLLFFVVTYLTWKFFQGRNLPPGPWGLPITGYLPFMGTQPLEIAFKNLSKKHGDVMSLYLGTKLIVVLNSFESIKEAFVKQGNNFSGRPSDVTTLKDADKGLIGGEGECWKEHRRFTLSTFRDYGMGKLSLEPRISEEVHYFLNELERQKGQPMDASELLGMTTQNIISTLEFGKRFDYNDEKFVRLRKLQTEFFDKFPIFPINAFFPIVNYLPFAEKITHQKEIDNGLDAIMEFIAELVEEHKAEYEEDSRKDLVDAYMTERKQVIQKNGEEGYFNAGEINVTLFGLFAAGAETITTMLRWAYLMVMIHPDMQKKIQDEIDHVIGMERNPSINDRSQMPYTEAFILEIFRFGSINPVNLGHANHEETELYGYRIPKRSIILSNLWAVHFDPNLWENPEEFKPERFINAEGKTKNPEYLIPFSIGKRACIGESLARMEIFLYFTGTLQRFELQPPIGTTAKLDIESKAAARRPRPYKFCAIQRKGYSIS